MVVLCIVYKIMIIQKFAKKIPKKKFILWCVIGALCFLVFAVIFVGVSIYALGWEDHFLIRSIASVVPYPIMRVNGSFVKFSSYQKDIATLVKFYNYEANVSGLPAPDYEAIRINVFDRLKRNEIMEQLAIKENVSVSKEEIDEEFYKIMVRAGSPDAAVETLKKMYGWGEEEFKNRIVYYVVLQEKLKNKIGLANDLDSAITDELAVAKISVYLR